MQRLLTLTSDDFYTGISAGAHVDRGGLWYKADGINVFRDTTASSENAGLLQSSPTPTDISSTIAGIPTDYAIDGTDMWFVTSGGDIGKVDLTGSSSATVVETSITNMGTGCEMFQPSGGSKYLYYFNGNTQIGRHDLSTTQTDAWATGLNSTTVRPIVKFEDRLYYGNVNTVGSIYGSTPSNDGNVLDLPADMLITALEDDGTFLVIAATTNTALNSTVYGETRVYFWNTNENSWTREFKIPDTFITALKRVGDTIYAVGGRGLWEFNFQTRPRKIRSLDTGDVPGDKYHGAISSINNAVLWGGGGNSEVLSYGEMMQGIGVSGVLHMPFQYATDLARTTMIAADVKTGTMYTGTANNNLYRWDLNSGGQTGLSAKTVFIPLAGKANLERIDLIFGEPLASGDEVDVDVRTDVDQTDNEDGSSFGTASYSNDGAVLRVSIEDMTLTDVENLQTTITFAGGNPKIKRIDYWGEFINT